MGGHTPSKSSEMPHLSAAFDADMEKFLDLDQNGVSSSSTSPDTRSSSSAGQSSTESTIGNSKSQQTFSGPSFQYDSYKQQTGLPVGGLANTFALNQATGMQYNGYGNGFIMPMETLNVPLTNLDEFDFATYPSMDMDLEADSPTDNMFYSTASFSKGAFVDPTSLLDQGRASSSTSAPVQRMYPGIHSELAAQAKAQQAQKQVMTGQQTKEMPQGQRPLPSTSKSQPAKDPHVEESISRLLNQMRQSSVVSVDGDCSTPTSNLPHLARLKKDEDEMDEDERLLASEEGKKLTSKERRQLRNKVSARAFRSRRKEYIGQLEGEVAMKVQEANDLKVQNRQLMEENTRLTDLTRMLLSSQAFSGFLSELSGTTPSSSARNLSQSKARAQPQPSKKDINPHQMASQMQNQHQQNGMATIADQTLDFSMTDNASSAQSWNTGLSLTNFPVYALTSLPEGPSLDIGKLSGKADNGLVSQPVRSVKCDMPIIEHSPFVSCEVDASPSILNNNMHHHAVETEESALSLYAEPPSHSRASVSLPPAAHRSANPKSGSRGFGPTSAVADDTESAAAARLALMCSRLDALSERIAAVTSHLT